MDPIGHKQSFRHLDLEVLKTIRHQMPGRPEIIGRIIESFLRSSPKLLQNLRMALDANDHEALRKAAHAMKSSNAQIGAVGLVACCQKLENLSIDQDNTEAEDLVSQLEREYALVEQELGLLLAGI
jgi:two-component system, sensor histidine kinase and response regulator